MKCHTCVMASSNGFSTPWIKLIGGWALALLLALALSWGAVSIVRGSVIESTGTIPQSVPDSNGSTDGFTIAGSSSVADPEFVATSSSAAGAADESSTTSIGAASTTADGSSTTSTTSPSSTTSTTTPGTSSTSTTSTTTPDSSTSTTSTTVAQQLIRKTYQLAGGTVTIDYAPGVVHFVAAVPKAGYSADAEEMGPSRVRVEFEASEATSKFRAEWVAGSLSITIDEGD